jgi:hypothetical protein
VGISHDLSKEVQHYWKQNPDADVEVVMKRFEITKNRASYAKKKALDPCTSAATTPTAAVQSTPPPPPPRRKTESQPTDATCNGPHFTGPLKLTERLFDTAMAIGDLRSGAGEEITFSSEEVSQMMQLANDEAAGLLRQMQQQ